MHLSLKTAATRVFTAVANLIILPFALSGGGMALTLQNGSQLGTTYSGGAAAEDASTIYFNPAGMMWLEDRQAVIAAPYVKFDGSFTNTGSLTGGLIPTPGSNERNLGINDFVPSLYVATPVSDNLAAGLGISVPFGLGTDYSPDWVGRYHALKSEMQVINVNPAIAWRLTDWLSLGAGLNWQHADGELTNAIDFGLIGFTQSIPGFEPHGSDGHLRIKASDSNFGYNAGAMFSFAHGTRLGVHYRSSMSHDLTGWARFSDVPDVFQPFFPNQRASLRLPLPSVTSVSFFHDITSSFSVMADWSRWDWSRMDAITVEFESPLTQDSVLPLGWKDSSIYSVGVRWIQNDRLRWRAGFAHNESPVPSAELRTPRIPDSDRTWYGLGVAWNFADNMRLDLGYAYLDFKKSSTMVDDGLGHMLVGDFALRINIVSAQLTWGF